MNEPPYRLGCPIWACAGWVGGLYSTANRRRWLGEYSQVFSTVEGNSTFYGLPALDTVRQWAEETAPGFRFSLKFPRAISHDARLVAAERDSAAFLEVLDVLRAADRLGPSFLQLPPEFSGRHRPALETYLRRWPAEFPAAVELRHDDYFAGGDAERDVNELLAELGMDRVIFDSRALFAGQPADASEQTARGRKPCPPTTRAVTASHPFVRFVGRNDLKAARAWIEEWAVTIEAWIGQGLQPYVFTHSPDDVNAPDFAAALHECVRTRCPALSPLAPLPGRAAPRQQSLF